jgi:hypothetical protein
MALSDDPHRSKLPSVRKRAIGDKHKHYSDSQKIEAVTTYLALGELKLTANVLKIPEITLKVWKQKDWWKEIENDLRTQEDLQLSVRLQKIINKSFDQVEDRLSNGDFIYDQKTGQLVRKPVSMKDAHKVAVDLVDKRRVLIDRQPQTASVESVEAKLLKLAEKFAEIAGKTKPQVEVTDVIFSGTDTVRGSGTDSLGDGDDNDPDGVLEGGDTDGEETTSESGKTTNV